MERYPQAKENIRVARRELSDAVRHEVDRAERGARRPRAGCWCGPPGTEPVVRVLAEAETDEEAAELCASIAALVAKELG